MSHRPKYKAKTIKPLKENLTINLHDFGYGHAYKLHAYKLQATKRTFDFIKTEKFCASKHD